MDVNTGSIARALNLQSEGQYKLLQIVKGIIVKILV
jgi:hypothetical protein